MLLGVGAAPCLGWKRTSQVTAERCAAEDPAMFTADPENCDLPHTPNKSCWLWTMGTDGMGWIPPGQPLQGAEGAAVRAAGTLPTSWPYFTAAALRGLLHAAVGTCTLRGTSSRLYTRLLYPVHPWHQSGRSRAEGGGDAPSTRLLVAPERPSARARIGCRWR